MARGARQQRLDPRMRFCDAAGQAILPRLDRVFEHEKGTRSGEDIEQLHDMRVASRRLRAAMAVFTPCFPKRSFKHLSRTAATLTRALGAVRDSDVMLEALGGYLKGRTEEERVGIEDVIASVRAERDVQRAAMIEALDRVKRLGFHDRLRQLIKAERRDRDGESLAEVAHRISAERADDLFAFADIVHDPERVDELHRMRIAAKRLRYSLEIFHDCFGPDIDGRIEDVKSIQEQIGQIHDCDVLVGLMRSHLAILAQREHEWLVAAALEPGPRETQVQRIKEALLSRTAADPRLGALVLLARKRDEREERHAAFVQWWDRRGAAGMRERLALCIDAATKQHAGGEDER